MTATNKPYITQTGRVLTDADIDASADEVEGDINVQALSPDGGAVRSSKADPPMFSLSASTRCSALRSMNAHRPTRPRRAKLSARRCAATFTLPDTTSAWEPRR